MKTKRKLIAVLLITVIISSLLPNLFSNAETEPSVTFSKTTVDAKVGDIVTVDINLENGMSGQKNFNFILNYDSTALEAIPDLISGDEKTLNTMKMVNDEFVQGSLYNSFVNGSGIVRGFIEDTDITVSYTSDLVLQKSGKIATLSFKVLKGGSSTVSFTEIEYNSDPNNKDGVSTDLTSDSTFTVNGIVPLIGLEVNPATASLEVGDATGFSFVKNPVDATMSDFKWSSSDTNVIKVGASGIVTAVGPGEAFVRITSGTVVGEAKVTVTAPIQDIKFKNVEKNKITIHKSEYFTVEAEKLPGNTTTTDPITWSSDNNAVATVDEAGKITAVAPGTTTITAKCADKEKT